VTDRVVTDFGTFEIPKWFRESEAWERHQHRVLPNRINPDGSLLLSLDDFYRALKD
jgi:hypothetical protein